MKPSQRSSPTINLKKLPEENNMTEIWKDIKDYEGLYQVSNFGRVKSLKRKWRLRERILKLMLHSKGYLFVGLFKNSKGRNFLCHRLVAKAFVSNPDNKPEVNHLDGIKTHNEDYNLEWCTPKENVQHSISKLGRIGPRGEVHGLTKLTEANIVFIRSSDLLQRELAKIFKVYQSSISRIKSKKRWKYLNK